MKKIRKIIMTLMMIILVALSGLESMPVKAVDTSAVTVALEGISNDAVSAIILAKDESGVVSRLESAVVGNTTQVDLPLGVYELSVVTLDSQSSILDTGKLANVDLNAGLSATIGVEPIAVTVISETPEQVLVENQVTVTYQITDLVGFIASGSVLVALGANQTAASIDSTQGDVVTLSATLTVPAADNSSLTLTITNAAWSAGSTPKMVHALSLDPQTPSAPALSTTAVAYNAVSLSWGSLLLVDYYQIWRSEGGNPFIKLIETTESIWVDSALKYQVSYRYKVVAVYTINGDPVTKESNIISTMTALETPITTVVNTNHTTNVVNWNGVSGASGYELYVSKGTGTFALLKTQTTTSFTHTKLVINTKYTYKVRAYRLVGKKKTYGAYSTVATALTLPSQATNVIALSGGISKLNVSWSAVSGASGYEVYASTFADKGFVLYANVTKNTATLSGLKINTPLYIKVRTYVTSGKVRIYSQYDSLVATGLPIPLSPVIKTSSLSYNTVKLSWTAIENASGYIIERLNPTDSTFSVIAETSSSQTEFNVTDLNVNASYSFRMRSYVDDVSGRVFSDYSAVVVGIPKLSTPGGLSVVSSQYNQLSITWAAVAGAEGYYVYRSTSSKFTGETLVYSGDQNQFTDTGLTTNSTYYYRLMAVINDKTTIIFSSYSSVVSGKPVPASTTVTAVSINHTTTSLSWDPVDGATGYDLYVATSAKGKFSLLTSTKAMSYLHTKRVLGATLYYKVVAYRTVGKTKVVGMNSTVVAVRSVPEQVKGLVGKSLSSDSVNVTWTAVKGASGYRVYIDNNASGAFVNVGGKVTTTSLTIHGLTINQPVSIKVNAIMMSGKTEVIGLNSTVIHVNPVPAAPTLTAKALDHRTVELSWSAVADVNGYAIYVWETSSNSFVWFRDVTATTDVIQDVPAGQSQKYVVLAYKMLGETRVEGTGSSEVSITPRLQAPVYSSLGAANYETISFVFPQVRSATSYVIYRGLSATTLSLHERISAEEYCISETECIFIDIGVMTGTAMFYQVQACVTESDVEYCGDLSEIRSATTVLEAPLEPWTFKNSTSSIVINYARTDGADGYEFYYSTTSGGKYTLFYTMVGSNGLEHTGLKSNTSYYYKMRAYRDVNGKKVYSAFTPVFSGRTAKTLNVAAELTFIGSDLVGIEISNNSSDTLRIMRFGFYNDYYYDYDDSLIDLRYSYYDLSGGYYTYLTFYYTYTPLYVLSVDNFMLNVIYDEISYYLFLYVDGRVVLYEDENYYYND